MFVNGNGLTAQVSAADQQATATAQALQQAQAQTQAQNKMLNAGAALLAVIVITYFAWKLFRSNNALEEVFGGALMLVMVYDLLNFSSAVKQDIATLNQGYANVIHGGLTSGANA